MAVVGIGGDLGDTLGNLGRRSIEAADGLVARSESMKWWLQDQRGRARWPCSRWMKPTW